MGILRTFVILITCICLTGCGKLFQNPFDLFDDDDDGPPSATPDRVIEPTEKYSLAIGGVAPGRDELVIHDAGGDVVSFDGKSLECEDEEGILILRPRPGFETAAEGSGVLMIATEPGVTAVRCTVDGEELEYVYEVTVPPQHLIQILVAEAGQQMKEEADTDSSDEEDVVSLESESPTGNALGSVIRNRINFINIDEDPELFVAIADDYYEDPPASYYDAVILAEGQFSPVAKYDPSNEIFEDSQDRNFLDGDWVVAYDQAVLTAAGIFNGDIKDTTGGSFAFRSPSAEEWSAIMAAWTSFELTVPASTGFSDATFPAFAPIQLLVHPDVWTYEDGRPSFVFARSKTAVDPAVSKSP